MTYESRYALLVKQFEVGLETYIEEVTVATLRIGKVPLPTGLRSRPGKALIVGRLYYVIPKNPKERK